jgi:hypothetical protein
MIKSFDFLIFLEKINFSHRFRFVISSTYFIISIYHSIASSFYLLTDIFFNLNWADKEFFLIFLYIASLEQTWQNSSNINSRIELRALINSTRSNINSRIEFKFSFETQLYDQINLKNYVMIMTRFKCLKKIKRKIFLRCDQEEKFLDFLSR